MRNEITTAGTKKFLGNVVDVLVDAAEEAERSSLARDVKLRRAAKVVEVLVSVGMTERDAVRHVTWHLDRELDLSMRDKQRLEALFDTGIGSGF